MKSFTLISLIILITFISCSDREGKVQISKQERKVKTIPFTITKGNNILFESVLNETDTLLFYFDSGGTQLVMLYDEIKSKTDLLEGLSEDYDSMETELISRPNTFSIGDMNWDSLTVYPFSVGPKEASGHFGWDLFDDMIVELDYDSLEMRIHKSIDGLTEGFVKMPIEYSHTLFCIDGAVKVNNQSYGGPYLFDTGFQQTVILDKDLREKANFPTDLLVISESVLRNSSGDKFVNQIVMSDQFCFNDLCMDSIPIQLFATPNPARFETHILGNEFLMNFNAILDFKNDFVYLKRNGLNALDS